MHNASGNADVAAALRDFESAMRATTTQIRQDLERARTVVRDATARLDRSFRTLHEATSAHRDALQSVASAILDAEGSTAGGFAASSEALLRQFVDEIVRVSRDSMRMIEQLNELSTKVDSINNCTDAIDGLARETRFIAFNARIETHRAGEAGRTFKVVADEVKRLANASATLSNQIRQSVSACQTELQAARKTATGLASHDMSRAIDSHRGLASAVGKLDSVNRDLDRMLETIGVNVSEAVRALQFEDMVSQILSATISRVDKLGELSVQALSVMERGHNGDRVAPLQEIVHSLRALGDRLAVQQQSMEHGSVELF
ncbi:MAG TPA: methyl-accepting chemotaxis protein [Polyangiales bacterium]|nr:methyl-accepting chemotaxis protein [Polyangiales bacterium]